MKTNTKSKTGAKKKKEEGKLTLPLFRLSYPNLFVPTAMEEGQKKKYQCAAIFTPAKFSPEDKERYQKLLAALEKASQGMHKKPWKTLASDKRGLRNGVEKEGTDGYGEGTRFATLSSTQPPGVVLSEKDDETGKFIVVSEENGNTDEIYPGCYCRATAVVYAYNNKSKGVAIGLRNIQKVKDGPRLDNRTPAEDDFEDDLSDEMMGDGDDDFGDDNDGDDSDFD